MGGELGLPWMVLRQRAHQCRNPITDLQRKMRRRGPNHLRELSLVGNGIDVFANGHDRDLATAGDDGDRR